MQTSSVAGRCFLCEPEPEWTWLESESFRAVLGLGPIGMGYTLIATRLHLPSMFDLDRHMAMELAEFTAEVRGRIGELWGPMVIGEHGRVAPCVASATRKHEPHCFHAHRLVFPGQRSLDLRAAAPKMHVLGYASSADVDSGAVGPGQYIYAEQSDGSCQVGLVDGPLPRQFLRAVVARDQGRRELADWRLSPRHDEVNAARCVLEGTAA